MNSFVVVDADAAAVNDVDFYFWEAAEVDGRISRFFSPFLG